jgi:hypothetical protein
MTPLLIAEVSSDSIKCNAGSALLTISAKGGIAPYIGTGSFSVKAGTHQFVVSDNSGQKDTVNITLNEPKAIALSVTAGSITSLNGTTSMTINSSGGTSPFLYSLNGETFQSSNIFYNLSAGNYLVTAKDINNCLATSSYSINTTNYFIVKVESANKDLPVYITILDGYGKIWYSLKGSIYTSYSIGQNLYPGTYYIKTTMGSSTYTFKVLKL